MHNGSNTTKIRFSCAVKVTQQNHVFIVLIDLALNCTTETRFHCAMELTQQNCVSVVLFDPTPNHTMDSCLCCAIAPFTTES